MTSRAVAGVLFGAIFSFGCGGEESNGAAPKEDTSKEGDPPAACTAEASCKGCGSCYDLCVCGGGSSDECTDECASDEPPPPPPPTEVNEEGHTTVTIVTEEFAIGPGEETFRCQNFANPFGKDVVVLKSESSMAAGSHHMFVFQGQGFRPGRLETCGGLEFGPNIHGSQRTKESFEYPPGVGRALSGGDNLRIQAHYLNTTDQTVNAYVAVTLEVTDPSEVEALASYLFINTLSVGISPHSTGSAAAGCQAPHDAKLIAASSHMHQHGTHFVARTRDGQLVYETNEWADPEPWKFDPAVLIPQGGGIDIHCEYKNDSSSYLTFGESAATNEMCILSGVYYPAPQGQPIVCLF